MTREELLDQCKEIVTRHRQSAYGTPEDNFARIASFWSTYLGVEVKPHDVASLMVLLKVARSLNSPQKPDNWIDMAGYAACGCEVATRDPKPVRDDQGRTPSDNNGDDIGITEEDDALLRDVFRRASEASKTGTVNERRE